MSLNLRLCGYFPKRTERERQLGSFALSMYEKIHGKNKRIKNLQLTFMKHKADWSNGFSWLVRYDTIEIVIPKKYKNKHTAKWIITHELCHAKQMLEGRLNKNLDKILYTNRRGETTEYRWVSSGQFQSMKSGRKFFFEPWEVEVRNMVDKYWGKTNQRKVRIYG